MEDYLWRNGTGGRTANGSGLCVYKLMQLITVFQLLVQRQAAGTSTSKFTGRHSTLDETGILELAKMPEFCRNIFQLSCFYHGFNVNVV